MTHPAHMLKALDRRPRKSLGQNFLADPGVARSIVRLAGVGEGSQVLEIGTGLGALSKPLLEAGATLVGVEQDRELAAWYRQQYPKVKLVEGNALTLDYPSICPGNDWICISNLPYNVATPLIMRLLLLGGTFQRLLLMVQREVAERMVSSAGSRIYGALSLEVQAMAEANIALRVSPGAFHPIPKVDSAVVDFRIRAVPATGGAALPIFRQVVRAAFAQRRKTLRNALGAAYGREVAEAMLHAADIDPGLRAEVLDGAAFGRLACHLEGLGLGPQ